MDFSFILPGIKGADRNITKEQIRKEINNIYALRAKLIAVGYNPDEVDFLIKSSNKGVKLSKLDFKKLQELGATLEAQLYIAKQCLEIVKDKD